MMSYVFYDDSDIEAVKKGIETIQTVLLGSDAEKKRRLLLALDWFMDPYYGQSGSIAAFRGELPALLQRVVVWSNEDEAAEDALNLLTAYEEPPFEILEKNLAQVPERRKPHVLEAIGQKGSGD